MTATPGNPIPRHDPRCPDCGAVGLHTCKPHTAPYRETVPYLTRLRDEIAKVALKSLMDRHLEGVGVAEECYKIADVMLAARGK